MKAEFKPCPYCEENPLIYTDEIVSYRNEVVYSIHHVCSKSDFEIEIDRKKTLAKLERAWNIKVNEVNEVKAGKWDMIQWAIDNKIDFIAYSSVGIYLDEMDIDKLRVAYEKREKDGK